MDSGAGRAGGAGETSRSRRRSPRARDAGRHDSRDRGLHVPEQARGHATDARSDIFSFGCVLYEMLAGRQPFQGETVTDVIASIVAREPDWRALPANLHPKVDEPIRRGLTKDRRRRWQAIGDVRIELEALMADPRGPEVHAARDSPRQPLWRRAIPLASMVILGAGIAAGVTVAVMKSRPLPPAIVTRFSLGFPASSALRLRRGMSSPSRQTVRASSMSLTGSFTAGAWATRSRGPFREQQATRAHHSFPRTAAGWDMRHGATTN